MHAPDGFLDAGTAVATGAVSAGTVGLALRRSADRLLDRQVPLAGLAAAFVFAAQMVNFPVLPGVSGHLLGGALAAILLGPTLGTLVVTVVVVVQAIVFADGGLTALGYNVLNMAVVTALGGYATFRVARRLLPATAVGVSVAAGLAAGLSVVLSAMAFSLEWLFGATAPVGFPTVFGLMVGVHALIGVGEGVITALTVRTVLGVRPDLVAGADGIRADGAAPSRLRSGRGLALAAVLVTMVIASIVSQFAVDDPDGLEWVAERAGIEGRSGPLAGSPFADYATAGIDNPAVSLAVAGVAGATLTLLVGAGLTMVARDRRRDPRDRVGT